MADTSNDISLARPSSSSLPSHRVHGHSPLRTLQRSSILNQNMSRLPLQRIGAGKGRICTGPGIKTRHYVTEPCASIATIDLNTRLQHSSVNKEQPALTTAATPYLQHSQVAKAILCLPLTELYTQLPRASFGLLGLSHCCFLRPNSIKIPTTFLKQLSRADSKITDKATRFVAEEPISGGNSEGPNPYVALLYIC